MANERDSIIFSKSSCVYTSCFCEENVWKMCEYVQTQRPELVDECQALFISNHKRLIPLWMQQKSGDPDTPVVWDYHVLLIHRGQEPMVYDLDTVLPFPVSLQIYLQEAIRKDPPREQFSRMFRIVRCREFLATFASDRSHMRREDGTYNSPPPHYPCIRTQDSANNIQEFISMANNGHGQVYDLNGFVAEYGLKLT